MRHSLCSVQLFTEPPTAQGPEVLYLVSLLLGTVVICITQRSHSVGSLGTTHDYGHYLAELNVMEQQHHIPHASHGSDGPWLETAAVSTDRATVAAVTPSR